MIKQLLSCELQLIRMFIWYVIGLIIMFYNIFVWLKQETMLLEKI